MWIVRRLELQVGQAARFDEPLDLAMFCSGAGPLWAERRTSLRRPATARTSRRAALWVHLDGEGTRPAIREMSQEKKKKKKKPIARFLRMQTQE